MPSVKGGDNFCIIGIGVVVVFAIVIGSGIVFVRVGNGICIASVASAAVSKLLQWQRFLGVIRSVGGAGICNIVVVNIVGVGIIDVVGIGGFVWCCFSVLSM